MTTTPDPFPLASRGGLPDDLTLLVSQYPREIWQSHENLGDMATFWLQRHDMFREMGAMLTGAIGDWREGRLEDKAFAGFFVPRLNWYLGNLDGHHNIEDHHYFPVFRKAEPRLVRGFDILDRDHHVIHDALEMNAEAARGFLEGLEQGGDALKRAGEAYATENERLMGFLTRHLEDEEDLIIPVILDQGERKLGVT
ncbi:hemerythrin domain-containing protein [Pseudohoeflea suaedae]|uniref:Hemerythrin domain-containing protein n=1 Tax=Pseudohoeflea suaedae TaxID=877384 RepID=A0A4R5PPG5_9HYPH|nr:hemerythrin domain-containing protein [Pseudohoeflea suaedae]TDH38972.1 hemerythrin domain-containing protein [Pseudohoeflea suaedae]